MPFIVVGIRVPCLKRYAYLKGCNELTAPTLLYPEARKLSTTVETIVSNSRWANESQTLTRAWLNFLGSSNGYHNLNASAVPETSVDDPGEKFFLSEDWLAWQYQQCTELG